MSAEVGRGVWERGCDEQARARTELRDACARLALAARQLDGAAVEGDSRGIARVARVQVPELQSAVLGAATAVATIAAHEGTLSALPEEVCP